MDETFEKPLFKLRDGLMDLAQWGVDKGLTTPERFKLTKEARREEVKKLSDAGMSQRRIAREVGVSQAQVSKDLTPKLSKSDKKVITYISPDIDNEDEPEERTDPRQLPNSVRIRGLVNRAREATEMARDDDMKGIKVTEDVRIIVSDAVDAWSDLLANITENEDD